MIRWRNSGDHPLTGRPSALGIALGALFFAASLTPSMIPRTGLMQGALGGVCLGVGYLIGVTLVALWDWVAERPAPSARALTRNLRWATLIALAALIWGLWNVTAWQNGIHLVMGLPPVETARPFTILATALALGGVLILLGRLFWRLKRVVTAQLEPFVPRRIAFASGLVVAGFVFWSLGNDVVLGRLLRFMDDSYAALDALVPPEQAAPQDPLKSGSAASLLSWTSLGAAGRDWVRSGPDAAAITALSGQPALDPLRVYVGLNTATSADERAKLALAEAIRIGAFDRSVLVIATPTGTGWMDPAAFAPLDHLTGGDVAVVAMQYSYLPSWLSLFVQPDYGTESARALFRAVHSHWSALPEATRPRLYLFGLSLGARNAEVSVTLPELVAAAPQGALLVGPPFASVNWQQVLASRQPGSPAWAPVVGDGAMVRVISQAPKPANATPWGPMRVVYLQYPSDPIVFFSTDVVWRRPDWLRGPRAPDVSADLTWFPVVTFLQLSFDMMTATTAPRGHGHVYAAAHYLAGWQVVLDTAAAPERLEALSRALTEQGL